MLLRFIFLLLLFSFQGRQQVAEEVRMEKAEDDPSVLEGSDHRERFKVL